VRAKTSQKTADCDPSGNVQHADIGTFLRDAIRDYFKPTGTKVSIKYINPSYIIRSVPANPHDSAFCLLLAHSAVHAGMRGRTNMVVGFWNHQFTHVPISPAASQRKKIDPKGTLWNSALASAPPPANRGKCIEKEKVRKGLNLLSYS
jgi:6-phosphofructokinase 1